MSETVPQTEPTETVSLPQTEPTETAPISFSDLPQPEPTPPPPIDISDLLNDITLVRQKEAGDKATLDGIAGVSNDSLRQRLLSWAAQGFPNAWPILELSIQPPSQCSDGVTRTLADYITFVSGKTISEHVETLQTRLSGIAPSYAWTGQTILIVVSRA